MSKSKGNVVMIDEASRGGMAIIQAQTFVQYIWNGELIPSRLVRFIPKDGVRRVQKGGTIIVRTA